ncbi:MAG: DMT family transporter [Bacillota bacterium]
MNLAALILLSALWGGSFIFVRVAAPVFGPVLLIELRVLMAGLLLLGYILATRGTPRFRAHWRHHLAVGVINSALPFVLIAAAELRLPASLASILNATTPLFAAVFAALMMGEVFTVRKAAGLAVGFIGAVAIIGLGPVPVTPATLVSAGLSLAAAVSYGLAPVYMRVKVPEEHPQVLAMGSLFFASLVLLPLVPFTLPRQAPSATAIGCVLGLVLTTAVAYLLFFRLIAEVGPIFASMNAYLVPAFGTLWGSLFLHERFDLGTLVGFGLILISVALVTKVTPRREAG